MKPEDVSILFTDLGSTFEPITGQPTDSDIVKMREVISEVLYQIPYDDDNGVHNLVGLIQDKESYTLEYKAPPPSQRSREFMTNPSVTLPKMRSIPKNRPH